MVPAKPTPERDDWEGLLVLADWYEEHGDPVEGAFWRWIGQNQKMAWQAPRPANAQWYPDNEPYDDDHSPEAEDLQSDIPAGLFALLGTKIDREMLSDYELTLSVHADRDEADRDLLAAFRKWVGG